VHRCERCGAVRRNKAAHDDPAFPDDMALLTELSTRPVPAADVIEAGRAATRHRRRTPR
jgi:hypothetical protein